MSSTTENIDSPSWEILPYRPEFRPQILKLQQHLWNETEALHSAYFEWKYERNPYATDYHIYVAVVAGNVIGMIGVFSMNWHSGSPSFSFLGLSLADLVIDPDYRVHKLDQELITFCCDRLFAEGYPYIFDLSAAPHVSLTLRMQGWRSLFIQTAELHRLPDANPEIARKDATFALRSEKARNSMMRVTKNWSIIKKVTSRLRKSVKLFVPNGSESMKPAFADLDANALQQSRANISLSKQARPQAMAELSTRIGEDNRISVARDDQFFSWRYKNPLSAYRFLYWGDQTIEGYFVLHTELGLHTDTWAYIVDWQVSSPEIWTDLLHATIEWGDFAELYLWTETLPEELGEILNVEGFSFNNSTGQLREDLNGENILVKILNTEAHEMSRGLSGQDVLELSSWNLRMIMSDAY